MIVILNSPGNLVYFGDILVGVLIMIVSLAIKNNLFFFDCSVIVSWPIVNNYFQGYFGWVYDFDSFLVALLECRE